MAKRKQEGGTIFRVLQWVKSEVQIDQVSFYLGYLQK